MSSLVRASSKPMQAQQAVLLRAATEGQKMPLEQLIRASTGQKRGPMQSHFSSRCTLLICGLLLAFLMGWTWRAYRQAVGNQVLTLAVYTTNATSEALKALREGADPNARADDCCFSWQDWLRARLQARREHATVLSALCTRRMRHIPHTRILAYWPENAKMVAALLQAGADVNAVDERGQTPLMKAVQSGYTETVTLLLTYHADVHAKDRAGHTALARAREEEWNNTIVRLLQQAGAKE